MDITKINNLQGIIDAARTTGPKKEVGQGGNSFGNVLTETIEKVNNLQTEANQSITKLVTDQSQDIHQTMIAMEKAEISFQLMMQARTKIVAAYEEIIKLQV